MSLPAASQAWLRYYRPRPAAPRKLFCFPYASGNATFFRAWAASLPSTIEVVAVQYPGRLDRINEPCIRDMDTLVDRVVAAMLPAIGDDVALFGHSMGAAVAYEVAYRLRHGLGRYVRQLFVSGYPAPRHHVPGVKHQGSDEALWAELRRLGGTSETALAHPELRRALMSTLRADYELIETYQPAVRPPLSAPITALTGDADPEAAVSQVAQWQRYTTERFTLRVLPGDHFYLVGQEDQVWDHIAIGVDVGQDNDPGAGAYPVTGSRPA